MKTKSLLPFSGLLICAVVAVSVLAADRDERSRKQAIPQWEHLVLMHDAEAPDQDLARTVPRLGREGWEMVTVSFWLSALAGMTREVPSVAVNVAPTLAFTKALA